MSHASSLRRTAARYPRAALGWGSGRPSRWISRSPRIKPDRKESVVAKILVVEDEPNNLELALRIVRHAGHEATVATDGFAALELAREHRPQLILLDLQLPKLDGWTVVKLLRKETWAKDVPIVAISASATPGDEHKAIEAGCTAFLSKPYYPAALREVLTQYLPAV